MKEELTRKMHAEFSVSPETEIKHRCWSALMLIDDIKDDSEVEDYAKKYDVTAEHIRFHSKEYYKLKNG